MQQMASGLLVCIQWYSHSYDFHRELPFAKQADGKSILMSHTSIKKHADASLNNFLFPLVLVVQLPWKKISEFYGFSLAHRGYLLMSSCCPLCWDEKWIRIQRKVTGSWPWSKHGLSEDELKVILLGNGSFLVNHGNGDILIILQDF